MTTKKMVIIFTCIERDERGIGKGGEGMGGGLRGRSHKVEKNNDKWIDIIIYPLI